MEWFGHAKITFTHAKDPLTLRTAAGHATDLLQVCEKAAPPCHLNPFLFNGHVQTFWTATKQHGPPIYYCRKVFDAEDKRYAGTFAVDFAVPPHSGTDPALPPRTKYFSEEELQNLSSDDSKPMLVVLHGLSGGSHEIYLRYAIAPLVESEKWEVCVVNSRGCAQSQVTSGIFYNARSTWDVRQSVKWLSETFPNRPLFGLGFSLGANILTNYLGEEGEHCILKGAIVCSNPFNLLVCNKSHQRTLIGKQVYNRVMGTSLKALFANHEESIRKYTNLDYYSIMETTYLYEFDRAVQCPTWGYPTEEAYYRDASSADSLLAIRIPTLALHAKDDPIAVDEAVPYEEFRQNPYTVLCTTSLGGHLCWFELGGTRWFSRPICNFFNMLAFDVDPTSYSTSSAPMAFRTLTGSKFEPMQRKLA